jgi:hypothetical protein
MAYLQGALDGPVQPGCDRRMGTNALRGGCRSWFSSYDAWSEEPEEALRTTAYYSRRYARSDKPVLDSYGTDSYGQVSA